MFACPEGSDHGLSNTYYTIAQLKVSTQKKAMKGTIYLRCPTNWAQSSECQSQNWRCSSQTQWGRSSAGNRQTKHQMGGKKKYFNLHTLAYSSLVVKPYSPIPPCIMFTGIVLPQSPPSIPTKSTRARLCVHQPGGRSSLSGVVRGLTSGKQSLANTWRRAVFPHWLSPTTTILHFTLWLGSIPDFRENFWHERLSFIDFTRDEMEMNESGPGATADAFTELVFLGSSCLPACPCPSHGVSACSVPVCSICLHL